MALEGDSCVILWDSDSISAEEKFLGNSCGETSINGSSDILVVSINASVLHTPGMWTVLGEMQWAANQSPTGELKNQTPANVVCFFSAWTAWIISYRTLSPHRCWIGHLSGRWFVAKVYDFPVWNNGLMWSLQLLGLIIKWKLPQPCFQVRYEVLGVSLAGIFLSQGIAAEGRGRWVDQGHITSPRQSCLSWQPGFTLLLSCLVDGQAAWALFYFSKTCFTHLDDER